MCNCAYVRMCVCVCAHLENEEHLYIKCYAYTCVQMVTTSSVWYSRLRSYSPPPPQQSSSPQDSVPRDVHVDSDACRFGGVLVLTAVGIIGLFTLPIILRASSI